MPEKQITFEMDPTLKTLYELANLMFFSDKESVREKARHQLRDYALAYRYGSTPGYVHREHCKKSMDDWVLR